MKLGKYVNHLWRNNTTQVVKLTDTLGLEPSKFNNSYGFNSLYPYQKIMTKKRELLFSVTTSDCKWDYYVGSGKGGQKRNKTANAVRCTHVASKAVGKAEDTRHQNKNKKLAFKRMAETEKFKVWVRLEASRISGKLQEIEEKIDRQMEEKNLHVEVKKDGKWQLA